MLITKLMAVYCERPAKHTKCCVSRTQRFEILKHVVYKVTIVFETAKKIAEISPHCANALKLWIIFAYLPSVWQL